jgi:hypothetical protein
MTLFTIIDGFIRSGMDRRAVSRASTFVLVMLLVLIISSVRPVGGSDYPAFVAVTLDDPPQTLGPFVLLTSNSTDNITAIMMADVEPPYYANEPFELVVAWQVSEEVIVPNVTVDVSMGMDELAFPRNITSVGFNYTGLPPSPVCCKEPMVSAFLGVNPSETDQAMVGRVSYGNESVNLTFPIDVGAARVILDADLHTPQEQRIWSEQEWTDVDVVMVNDGGAPAIDLVVDFRYGGRIVHTEEINLVPAHGNYTFPIMFQPIHGQDLMEVFLVSGTGVPGVLATFNLTVNDRPVLRVLSLEVDETAVEEGDIVVATATVVNSGNASSSGEAVEFLVDGNVVANISLDMMPGKSLKVNMSWKSKGDGIHSFAARIEGQELMAEPAVVEVEKVQVPGPGPVAILLALVVSTWIKRVGSRSKRAVRA